jgi:hypothetical protein
VWSAPAEHYAAGRWTLGWDGRTAHGLASTGIYLARVHVDSTWLLRRIAVVR